MEVSGKAVVIRWLARILCIAAIIFISVLSLDAFSSTNTFVQNAEAFLMHMIPSFVLLTILVLTWKNQLLGGMIYTLVGLALIPFIYQHNFSMNHSIGITLSVIAVINLPFIVVGLLFIISDRIYLRERI